MPEFFIHRNALAESAEIGPGTRVWAFAHVMKGAVVGAQCNIGDHCFIESGARLGNNVTVKNGVSIWDKITIEDDVFIGPNAAFTNDLNPRASIKKASAQLVPTTIQKGATIGANATIVCGVTLGRYAFVGAGAVITRSVGDYELWVGNPARRIGWMCACGSRLQFEGLAGLTNTTVCPSCRIAYTRGDSKIEERSCSK